MGGRGVVGRGVMGGGEMRGCSAIAVVVVVVAVGCPSRGAWGRAQAREGTWANEAGRQGAMQPG